MNGVQTMELDPDYARAQLKAYRESVHKDAERIYMRAAEVYAQAAKGRKILDVSKAFADPPLDHKRRPRLALARADRDEVYLHAGHSSDVYQFGAPGGSWHSGGRHAPSQDRSIRRGSPDSWESAYACVPMVPANVRPKRGQLRSFYILSEVDRWADRSKHAPPPVDPFLLKWLGGTLYAVLAAWDLTEIERAIMAEASR